MNGLRYDEYKISVLKILFITRRKIFYANVKYFSVLIHRCKVCKQNSDKKRLSADESDCFSDAVR